MKKKQICILKTNNMKRKTIIWIIIVCWFASLFGIYFISNYAVDEKQHKLYRQAISAIDDHFNDHEQYFRIKYSGEKVSYQQIPIKKPWLLGRESDDYKIKERWESQYGDINKLYVLIPRYEDDYEWTGWEFHGIEKYDDDVVEESVIYPYQVGLKKQNDYYGYLFMPTIQEAVNKSFEFHTTNPESSFFNDFSKEKSGIYNLKSKVDNDYFFLWSYDNDCEIMGKNRVDSMIRWTVWSDFPVYPHLLPCEHYLAKQSFDYGGMENGYYRVYNRCIRLAIWELKYNWRSDNKTKDLRRLRIICGGIATLLMLAFVIPLSVIEKKKKKLSNESLQDRLKRLCNPKNFIKNYDKEKVEKANVLYQQLLNDKLDKESLNTIKQEAISTLGISLIDEYQIKELKDKVNPQRFIKHYNAEKVSLANELYSKITKENLSYEEFVEIKNESKKLYK